MILIAVFGAVILVLLTIILLILFRKRCCEGLAAKAAKNAGEGDGKGAPRELSAHDNRQNVVKVNNLVEQLGGMGGGQDSAPHAHGGWGGVGWRGTPHSIIPTGYDLAQH